MSRRIRIAAAVLLVCSWAAFAATSAQRQADLDWIRIELPRRHLNLFAVTSRTAFEAAAADLQRSLAEFSDEQFYTALLALVASARDAHTNMSIDGSAASAVGFRPLAVQLRWFDDGLFVTAAERQFSELNGAKVLAIQGVTTAEVIERLRPVISFENDWWFTALVGNYAANLGILRGVGLTGAGELPRFTLLLGDGEVREVEVAARTGTLVRAVDPETGFAPVGSRRTDENYWAEYWPATETLYLAYRRCAESPTKPISQFVREVSELLQAGPLRTIVVDLRGNTGGNSIFFEQLIDGLLPALNSAAGRNPLLRGYALTDRLVFSSGMLAAHSLRVRFGANLPLIGEPTGGSPVGYGDVLGFRLPGTGLTGIYSTEYFNIVPGKTSIEPAVYIGTRSTDYFSRHDPQLMAVLAHAMPESGWSSGDVRVVSAATMRQDTPVAPGSMVTAFGEFTGIADVRVNGVGAQVIGATSSQVSFVIPEGTKAGEATVEVGGKSGRVMVSFRGPALFVRNAGDPAQPAAALNEDGVVNGADTPLRRGGAIRLYATGASEGLSLWVGDERIAARVLPESAGVQIIEARVPDTLTGLVPVKVVDAGAPGNSVSITVARE